MKGHLRQRGDAWELRAYAGTDPTTGRQKYVTRTFRGGKRAAEDALARLVIEVSGGGCAAQDATVGDLVRQWLELAKPELSPSTVRGYELQIRTQIVPAIGRVRLARLTTAQLDHFYARLRQSGGQDNKPLAPATARKVHAIVRDEHDAYRVSSAQQRRSLPSRPSPDRPARRAGEAICRGACCDPPARRAGCRLLGWSIRADPALYVFLDGTVAIATTDGTNYQLADGVLDAVSDPDAAARAIAGRAGRRVLLRAAV
jgi:hypothetical protein